MNKKWVSQIIFCSYKEYYDYDLSLVLHKTIKIEKNSFNLTISNKQDLKQYSLNLIMSAALEPLNLKETLIYSAISLAVILIIKILWSRRHLYRLSYQCQGGFAWPLVGNLLGFSNISGESELNSRNII